MDYAFRPPEVNSALMYTGPGAGSFMAAASNWDTLSAALSTTAEGFAAVLAELATWQWNGPASQAMTAAAVNYADWLQATAELTSQTAQQVRAAAAAYEQAHAMTIPPPAIAANRAQLASLTATNLLGQNTAAIAATEAQYADYWAQDTAAMTGYQGASTAATQLATFLAPGQRTNESGLAAQADAVNHASAAAADPVSQFISAATQTLESFAADPAEAAMAAELLVLDAIFLVATAIGSTNAVQGFSGGIIGSARNLGLLPQPAAAPAPPAAPVRPPIPGIAKLGGEGLGKVTALRAGAGTVGQLSVPVSWAPPTTSGISRFTPAGFTMIPGNSDAVVSGYPGYPGLPAGAAKGAGMGSPPRYGSRITVMPRSPVTG